MSDRNKHGLGGQADTNISPLPSVTFDNIYLDLSKENGKCRFAENGLGWKPAGGGDAFTLDQSNIHGAQWSRAAMGFEVKILHRNSGIIQLDGFQQEVRLSARPALPPADLKQDYEHLSKIFKNWYSHNLENKEHSLRGWNWGKAEFGKAELTFNVQNRPSFEVPYSEISNTSLAGRNEISVEFAVHEDGKSNGESGPNKRRKAAAGKDQLVEVRFYIPGTTTQKEAEGEDAASDADEEEKNAVTLFYDTLIEKAEIGETAGDTIATFLNVLHLTPRYVIVVLRPCVSHMLTCRRGRCDIDMYDGSFRLRGKTYDYKIQYDAIKKFMVLPKPDDAHFMLCIGLDPPLRQGQTRYPFVVMQIKKDEEVTLDLNITEEELNGKYKDKLQAHYENPLHQVVTYIFKGLANKKVTTPAKDFQTYVFYLFWRWWRPSNERQTPTTAGDQVLHQSERGLPILLGEGFHVRAKARNVHLVRTDAIRHLFPRVGSRVGAIDL